MSATPRSVQGDPSKRARRRPALLRWWDRTSEKLRRLIKPLVKPLYRRLQIRSVIAWFLPGWGEVTKSKGGLSLAGNLLGDNTESPLIGVVADFGSGKPAAFDVSRLVARQGAQAVVTAGDNIYFQSGSQGLVCDLYGK